MYIAHLGARSRLATSRIPRPAPQGRPHVRLAQQQLRHRVCPRVVLYRVLQEEHDGLEVHRPKLFAEAEKEGQADVGMEGCEGVGAFALEIHVIFAVSPQHGILIAQEADVHTMYVSHMRMTALTGRTRKNRR